jgi:hypothetical protein
MPPKKAPGISFATTKGVSEISLSYIFKASWTSADIIKVLFCGIRGSDGGEG